MAEAKIQAIRSDIDELSLLMKQAKRKKVQDILSLEIRKFETEWVKLKEAAQAPATSMDVSPTHTSLPQNKRYQVKLNGYGWDQSDKYVKIFVTLKNAQTVPKDQVYCKLTNRSMELHIDDLEGKDYVLTINGLLDGIDVDQSHWKQKTDMVVVFLHKSRQGVKWSYVTEIEKKFEDQKKSKFNPEGAENTTNPQESIMGLMKNMYDAGDDDMKRMITKAWYEGHQKKTDRIDDL